MFSELSSSPDDTRIPYHFQTTAFQNLGNYIMKIQNPIRHFVNYITPSLSELQAKVICYPWRYPDGNFSFLEAPEFLLNH